MNETDLFLPIIPNIYYLLLINDYIGNLPNTPLSNNL